jgi:uncharacterized phosphosugar-binding protein
VSGQPQQLPEVVEVTGKVIRSLGNGEPGDALVSIEGSRAKAGPGSTIAGAVLVDSMMVEVMELLAKRGATPGILHSSNNNGKVGALENARVASDFARKFSERQVRMQLRTRETLAD